MTLEEENIIDEVIKEVFEKYNYVPETLASFNNTEKLLRMLKSWEEYLNKESE